MANIYVGNIPYMATTNDIHKLFQPFGEVKYVNIITDPDTGRSKGFCFVEMEPSASRKAIEALNQTEMAGRRLVVNEARPRAKPTGHFRPSMRQGLTGERESY